MRVRNSSPVLMEQTTEPEWAGGAWCNSFLTISLSFFIDHLLMNHIYAFFLYCFVNSEFIHIFIYTCKYSIWSFILYLFQLAVGLKFHPNITYIIQTVLSCFSFLRFHIIPFLTYILFFTHSYLDSNFYYSTFLWIHLLVTCWLFEGYIFLSIRCYKMSDTTF